MLRLRREGAAAGWPPVRAGTHEHSATLGSGSARKDYLLGFGRGYVLRKWGVLRPRRLPAVLARELALTAGQAVVDRNLGGARGRLRGLRAARASEPYPAGRAAARPTLAGLHAAPALAPPRGGSRAGPTEPPGRGSFTAIPA